MPAFCRLYLCIAMSVACTAITISSAYAEKRVALVIGNDKYPNLPANQQLLKAGNDADAVGNAFASLGFQVIRGKNLGRQAIIDSLSELTSAVGPDDIVALFFAGHGVAMGGANYILPSDVPAVVTGESRVRGASIAESDLIAEIQTKNVRVALLILDACRDNPFPISGTRSIGNMRGLTESKPARGVFTIYSAGIGQQALDRLNDNEKNPNSVFTRVFAQKLTQAGLTLGDLAVEVREQVADLAQTLKDPDGTPHEQTPAYYDQTIGGRVYLAGRGSSENPKPTLTLPQVVSPPIDEITWDILKQSSDVDSLRRFTSQFPSSLRKAEAIQRIADLERTTKDAQSKAKRATETPKAPSSRLALALVADDPAMASGAPLRQYGNSNTTYRIERDITFPGDIERFDAIFDQMGLPAISIVLAATALDRINGGAGVVGRQIALVLDGRTVLSAAKLMAPLASNLQLSGNFSVNDMKRLVDAVAASPSANR